MEYIRRRMLAGEQNPIDKFLSRKRIPNVSDNQEYTSNRHYRLAQSMMNRIHGRWSR
jgi:hypothetical protein